VGLRNWLAAFVGKRPRGPELEDPWTVSPNRFSVTVAALSDIGCVRNENQDTVYLDNPAPDHPDAWHGVLAIVADGMGGHLGGAVASRVAVDVLSAHMQQASPAEHPLLTLATGIAAANAEVHRRAQTDPTLARMGTTLSALLIRGGSAFVAHAGDTRVFRRRGDRIEQVTIDDTMVGKLLREGFISLSEAASHPDRGLVVRAVGINAELQAAVFEVHGAVEPGDIFALCSDGLHDLVSLEEISATIANYAPAAACERLIRMAKERGGPDNVSISVLAVQPADNAPDLTITRPEVASDDNPTRPRIKPGMQADR
jgi:protein phosphatase